MFQLILAIMAIAIFATLLGFGIGGVHPMITDRKVTSIDADGGYRALQLASIAYRMANGALPTPDTGGQLTSLVPTYTVMPTAPDGMVWSAGSDSPGRSLWVCLSGSAISQAQWQGLIISAKLHPVGSNVLDASCRAPTGAASTFNPVQFPTQGAMSFQIY